MLVDSSEVIHALSIIVTFNVQDALQFQAALHSILFMMFLGNNYLNLIIANWTGFADDVLDLPWRCVNV